MLFLDILHRDSPIFAPRTESNYVSMSLPLIVLLLLHPIHCQAVAALPEGTEHLQFNQSALNLSRILPNEITEWTAMGDSYAVGIGAGGLLPSLSRIGSDTCYRFNQSYNGLLQSFDLVPKPRSFNYVACSGSTFQQILGDQFQDANHCKLRNFRYQCWPAWGSRPAFITLTMGGNDVNIVQLIQACILNIDISRKGCDGLIDGAFDILRSDDFQINAIGVLQKALTKGVAGYGPGFHIYMLGYAQFFNATTTQCDRISLQPPWVPRDPSRVFLTQYRRIRMNELARTLNDRLQTIAATFPSTSVTFLSYDHLFQGHRFCDRTEADANDPLTWFFSWNSTADPPLQPGDNLTSQETLLQRDLAMHRVYTSAGFLNASDPVNGTTVDIEDDAAFYEALFRAADNDTDVDSPVYEFVRIFHPKSPGHQAIEQILKPLIASRFLGSGFDIGEFNVSSIP